MLTTIEKILFLKKVALFEHIPPKDLAVIAQISVQETYPRSITIFEKDEQGDALYLIVNGKVKIHHGENQLSELKSGDVFGEMAILDSEPRSASVTTKEETLLLKIHREDFAELLHEKPEIASGIIRVLTFRLRDANLKSNSYT